MFGTTITISTGREIPVRWIGEQHCIEDCGYIPSVSDWVSCIEPQPWMNRPTKLSREQEEERQAAEKVAA